MELLGLKMSHFWFWHSAAAISAFSKNENSKKIQINKLKIRRVDHSMVDHKKLSFKLNRLNLELRNDFKAIVTVYNEPATYRRARLFGKCSEECPPERRH